MGNAKSENKAMNHSYDLPSQEATAFAKNPDEFVNVNEFSEDTKIAKKDVAFTHDALNKIPDNRESVGGRRSPLPPPRKVIEHDHDNAIRSVPHATDDDLQTPLLHANPNASISPPDQSEAPAIEDDDESVGGQRRPHSPSQKVIDHDNARRTIPHVTDNDLLTALLPATQNEIISPTEIQLAPAIDDSLPSNPIESIQTDEHIVVTVSDDESTHNRTINGCFAKAAFKWGFVIANLILEIPAAVCDQLSSPRRPVYALIGLVTSLLAFTICVGELIYKSPREIMTQAVRFFYPFPYNAIFSSFVGTFGFIFAALQCLFSAVQYIYFKQHEDDPIKLNIFPLLFAACLALSVATQKKPDIETERTG